MGDTYQLLIGGEFVDATSGQTFGPFVAEHFRPLLSHAADPSFPFRHLIELGSVTVAVWLVARGAGWVLTGLFAMVGVTPAIRDSSWCPGEEPAEHRLNGSPPWLERKETKRGHRPQGRD
jgi:hypothetical protein